MANPAPETRHLAEYQWQTIGDRPLGKVIGTRYPTDIEAKLRELPDHQSFIRAAVEQALLQSEVEPVQQAIAAVLLSIPPKDRRAARRLFKKLVNQLQQS